MKIPKFIQIIGLIAVFIFSGSVMADTYIEMVTHTDGFQMMGKEQPPQDDTIAMWLGDGVARSYTKEGSILIDSKKEMIYLIDDDKKAYNEISFDILGDMKKMMGLDQMEAEEAKMAEQQMQVMMAMMQISATVTPTDETREIKGYKCKKYLVNMQLSMANVKADYWVSKDIDLDYDAFKKLNLSKMLFMPGADKVIDEFAKLDGFMVYSEGTTNMMGTDVKSTTELIKAENKNAPAGTFKIPEGYKKEVLKPMGEE